MVPPPDPESISLPRVILAFSVVLGLLAMLAFILKYIANKTPFSPLRTLGSQQRLKVIESLPLDLRHRLIIVRHDGKEHLLLLGPTNDLHVSSQPAREE